MVISLFQRRSSMARRSLRRRSPHQAMLLIRPLRRSKRLWLSARLQRKPPSGNRCLFLFNHLTVEGN